MPLWHCSSVSFFSREERKNSVSIGNLDAPFLFFESLVGTGIVVDSG